MLAPRSTALLRTRRPVERAARGFLVVQQGANPTADYYLAPRFPEAITRYAELRGGWRGVEARPGEFVVFCRYVDAGWLDWLEANRTRTAGAALFLDDDFDLALHSRSAPLAYRWRIWSKHHRHLSRIARSIDELWVSTQTLAERYGGAALVLPPVPPAMEPAASHGSGVLLAYHATRVHRAELDWLTPVVGRILARLPEVRCEIVGFRRRDLPAPLPRTEVKRQLPWDEYRRLTVTCRAEIGLAPLLPGALNDARSAVKAFDITRMGAVGVFGDSVTYEGLVEHGRDGLLLPPDPQIWEEQIVSLVRDAPRRRAMGSAMAGKLARLRVELLADRNPLDRLLAQPATNGR
jgi:hypothetical protein